MSLVANPLDYPTIESDYYFKLVEDNKDYEQRLAKIARQDIKKDISYEEATEIIGEHDILYRELIDLIIEGWKVVIANKNKFNDILKNPLKFPNWVYGDNPIKVHRKIKPILKKWKKEINRRNLNFFLFIRILSLFYVSGARKTCSFILSEKKKNLEELLNFNQVELNNQIKIINWAIQTIEDMKAGRIEWTDLINRSKQGDFSIYQNNANKVWVESMYQAIQENLEAKKWFANDGEIDSKDPIKYKLLHNPEVLKCNHNRVSLSWTFKQFQTIYQEGWSNWVIPILLDYGIGWDNLNFYQALSYGNERMAIEKFKWGPQINSSYEILEIATTKNMSNLVELILEKSANKIKAEEYEILAIYCDKNGYTKCKTLLLDKWDQLYHRKINLNRISLKEFIKRIWHHKRNIWNEKEPTEDDIKDFIINKRSALKGVFIKIDWVNWKIDPFDYPNLLFC